ncbi:hypothetical protein FK535_16005 [Mycolicibacterium sp. 018/SC-01/001]|uniref:hypothetical protein n=1 Tax=Mycolicibacterium sp. 018/SC-01/001 TaxID=2592069 RepID=UPI00117D21DA|nr:hypothetical protein [Mycolicibacterium sp. 018/SC-01/001]TRW81401.1 hypothetical protein FK535_16005 [Mycolicibacterium sp. 018/SC-01/001]
MVTRVFAAAVTVAAAVGVALLPTTVSSTAVAQEPWDPGCWGPFAWGSYSCDWSQPSGTSGGWDPSITGPGQFTPPRTGQGTTGSR